MPKRKRSRKESAWASLPEERKRERLELLRIWYIRNREKCLKYQKLYYSRNREERIKYQKRWIANNPDKVREHYLRANEKRRKQGGV
jgi:hypothetical protein